MGFVNLKDISLTYGENQVLFDLNLSIQKGELITLLGPSGCGKSSLLKVIAGIEQINKGEMYIDGKDIMKKEPSKRDLGMVFQSYALFPTMTVYGNIEFGLKMKKIDKEIRHADVKEMIELVGLTGRENAYPNELSGGQQQRVALARALVLKPKVLLLDEPLSALDAQIRKKLQHQLKDIQKKLGTTMIFVTHDQEEAMAISDRIFLMKEGRIEQYGTPDEIYEHPETEFVARFIGSYNLLTVADIKTLFPNELLKEGELFAIRPEVFHLYNEESPDRCRGRISEKILLGNVIRYTILVTPDLFIKVEELNHSVARNVDDIVYFAIKDGGLVKVK